MLLFSYINIFFFVIDAFCLILPLERNNEVMGSVVSLIVRFIT